MPVSWNKFVNFQRIFNRDDFNYISDLNNIVLVLDPIMIGIHDPKRDNIGYSALVKDYLTNLQSFSSWIGGTEISELAQGFATCISVLSETLNILNQSAEKRILYENRRNKLIKIFEGSLSKIAKGLCVAFNPEIIPFTNIAAEQVCRYILDGKIGLGTKFKFNKRGNCAFAGKIYALNMQELLVVLRLLLRPGNQVRTFNKWKDLGAGGTVVRILVQPHWIRKDKVFFLYKANEHTEYSSQLTIPPDKTSFEAV